MSVVLIIKLATNIRVILGRDDNTAVVCTETLLNFGNAIHQRNTKDSQ